MLTPREAQLINRDDETEVPRQVGLQLVCLFAKSPQHLTSREMIRANERIRKALHDGTMIRFSIHEHQGPHRDGVEDEPFTDKRLWGHHSTHAMRANLSLGWQQNAPGGNVSWERRIRLRGLQYTDMPSFQAKRGTQ